MPEGKMFQWNFIPLRGLHFYIPLVLINLTKQTIPKKIIIQSRLLNPFKKSLLSLVTFNGQICNPFQ